MLIFSGGAKDWAHGVFSQGINKFTSRIGMDFHPLNLIHGVHRHEIASPLKNLNSENAIIIANAACFEDLSGFD
jgi:hypothetical protein